MLIIHRIIRIRYIYKWEHLTVGKMSSGSYKNDIYQTCLENISLMYMYKNDLA